ncbi:MAG: ExbD/TolR family protein [Pseudobdellovibrionaceae bacterium]
MAMNSKNESQSVGEINEINITPFVDVVLVLLVIFMVTAPMMMKDVLNIQLPKTSSSDSQTMSTIGIAITKQGQILYNGELIAEEVLETRMRDAKNQNANTQVVITADQEAVHRDFVKVLDIVKTQGIENFAIQVERRTLQTE